MDCPIAEGDKDPGRIEDGVPGDCAERRLVDEPGEVVLVWDSERSVVLNAQVTASSRARRAQKHATHAGPNAPRPPRGRLPRKRRVFGTKEAELAHNSIIPPISAPGELQGGSRTPPYSDLEAPQRGRRLSSCGRTAAAGPSAERGRRDPQDLRVIAETCENPAVFLHYPVWRNRLPLGDRITVTDEIDLWGSYLSCERFTGLQEEGRMIIGNASTDFDAYYDGLAGRGPKREPPRMFLPESVRAFVGRLAVTRPPGWREATGVCLDLSIPELAFVDGKLREVASEAAAGPVSLIAGRVLLLGLPRRVNASEGLMLYDPGEGDPTFAIACRLGITGEPEVAWAQYRKPFTSELSDFEEEAHAHVASSLAPDYSAHGRRRPRG